MERTNESWIHSLKSRDVIIRDKAILELHKLLLRGLNAAFKNNICATHTMLEDAAQDSLLRIIARLDTFRGESNFLTWVMKVAIRIVYAEMRKAGWKDVSFEDASESGGLNLVDLVSSELSAEQRALQTFIVEKLWEAVNESLTDKQRDALIADFVTGMPIEEIARKTNSSRNSVYKLLYDARQNLKKYLIACNINEEVIATAFGDLRVVV